MKSIPLSRNSIAASLALLALCIGGCGGPSSVGVTGEVTLDGQPLPLGTVEFEPALESDGQRRDANVAEGRFALPDDQGMLPGQEFQVVIKAFRKTGRKYPNADMSTSFDETEQYLPEKYNAASTLRVTVSRNAKDNHYIFELTSAGSM